MSSKLDTILDKLLSIRSRPPGVRSSISRADIEYLCSASRAIFLQQPVLLELSPPLTVVGDVHGQYRDLHRIFSVCGYPPRASYLFLGDYVDRGKQSVDTLCLLLALKVRFPETFFMLRGNHESAAISRLYGLYDECCAHFGSAVWDMLCGVFGCLPVAAVVGGRIFCVHGGISPALRSLDDIRALRRPAEVPDSGLLCDLLWSDPDPDARGWEPNERGTSHVFGAAQARDFLDRFDFDLICRAHQAVDGGYEFPFDDESLVTLFSAPNYCYEYKNRGGLLCVDKDLLCTLRVLEPVDWGASGAARGRLGTPPRRRRRRAQR